MAHESPSQYPQQLKRGLGFLGNASITLSFLTPTASLFLTAAVLLTLVGTASFLSFAVAGVAALGMAFCFAELGSAFPVVGGQYAVVMRVLGRPAGFVAFILFLTLGIFTISASSLVVGTYLKAVWPHINTRDVAWAMILVATAVGVFGIRLNALLTGLFLLLELIVVLTVVIVGFGHVHQPVSTLWNVHHPLDVGLSGVISGMAIALFAYNGYDTAIVFSEETHGRRRNIAKAVLVSFFVALVFEVAAVAATLLGAPSLTDMVKASSPIGYTVQANSSSGLNKALSLGVALAIFNADIAAVLAFGRVIYGSARDRAWPEPVNRWFADVHGRLRTPWIATIVLGVGCAILTAVSTIAALVTFVGVVLCVLYALVAISALVSRFTQRELVRPYRMPVWPVPVLLGLAGASIALSKQTGHDVGIVAAICGGAAGYYFLFLHRRAEAWRGLAPAPESAGPEEGLEPAPAVSI